MPSVVTLCTAWVVEVVVGNPRARRSVVAVGCHRSQLGRQPAGVSDAARRHAEWLEHGLLHVGWEHLSSHIGDHVVKQAVAQV